MNAYKLTSTLNFSYIDYALDETNLYYMYCVPRDILTPLWKHMSWKTTSLNVSSCPDGRRMKMSRYTIHSTHPVVHWSEVDVEETLCGIPRTMVHPGGIIDSGLSWLRARMTPVCTKVAFAFTKLYSYSWLNGWRRRSPVSCASSTTHAGCFDYMYLTLNPEEPRILIRPVLSPHIACVLSFLWPGGGGVTICYVHLSRFVTYRCQDTRGTCPSLYMT